MSSDEVRLAKQWVVQDNLPPSEIAERLGRDKSTITRLLKPGSNRKQRGRKAPM
jgi:IS30 family transposase